ncbi:heavy metal-associated domain-containing protein [Neobacillus drentensis]|uniref:heavy-metal-associated domain-containing protein n=1 Tax=Neobacillus drentensis TaxID=220684 RepID=UPI002FFF2DD4
MTVYLNEAVKEQPIQTLETILAGMNGIERALVDLEDGEVKIEYNENQLSQEKIMDKILQNGFHVKK